MKYNYFILTQIVHSEHHNVVNCSKHFILVAK